MERRELLKMIASATGMAMIGIGIGLPGTVLGYGRTPLQAPGNAFSAKDVESLDEIAETILPRTDTPGAKDAGAGLFIAQYVTDCYTPEEQAIFRAGLADIDARAGGGGFIALKPAARTDLLRALDTEAKARVAAIAAGDQEQAPHYFTMLKQLAIFSFFTSKVGATQALRYVAVPGYYDGDMAYTPGTPAWATT